MLENPTERVIVFAAVVSATLKMAPAVEGLEAEAYAWRPESFRSTFTLCPPF
jgi:hypothetical protein